MNICNRFVNKVKEITIKVPWGKIAGKWWGPDTVRPILCMHGRGDNAGSFDRLIPLLPKHLSYLAIDVPGHGYSTRIPDGQAYTLINFLYWIQLIHQHFKWEKMSLLGHSMSAAHCFLYAGLFPQRCDLLIQLDFIAPIYQDGKGEMEYIRDVLMATAVADRRNQTTKQPPVYSRDELIAKIAEKKFFSEISEEAAPYLLRGMMPSASNPDKFYLPFDRRIQNTYPQLSTGASVQVARAIEAPFCYIKSRNARIPNYGEAPILAILEQKASFEQHQVEGDHHIHLNSPTVVSEIISQFICKHRPSVSSSTAPPPPSKPLANL